MVQQQCLLYPVSSTGIWLGYKNTKIGAGSLNGSGGKLKAGESPSAATVRETKEEWGIDVAISDLKLVALLHISREGIGHEIDLHVYTTRKWVGEFTKSRELEVPEHYVFEVVPYKKMMPADVLWLKPVLLSGLCVEASFTYNHDRTEVSFIKMHALPP